MRASALRLDRLRPLSGVALLAIAAGCAREHANLRPEPTQAPSAGPAAPTKVVETDDFTLALPDGYADVSGDFKEQKPQLSVVLRANAQRLGHQATIVVRKAPLPGGSFDDPAVCTQTGNGLVTGGSAGGGTGGTLVRAAIIDGPVGKTCQIHLRAPAGVALITELHRPGNTPASPQDLWLMTCNHADGDESAEATCRSTLAGFRFRSK